jgi:hypothetical protein
MTSTVSASQSELESRFERPLLFLNAVPNTRPVSE